LLTVQVRTEADAQAVQPHAQTTGVSYQHANIDGLAGEAAPEPQGDGASGSTPQGPRPIVRQGPKLGRNDPCWCGSGKKYKHCHGRLE